MLKFLYSKGKRLLPSDITRVLMWNLEDVKSVLPDPDLTLKSLDTAQLSVWLHKPEYELNESTVQSVDQNHVECIGVFVGEQLAGYIFFCDSPVDPQHNSGGSTFTGIGLEFSDNVRYLYKALVLPAFRGRRLAQQIMRYAAYVFHTGSVNYFVTTTEWTNQAFLHTAKSVGFDTVGTAGEFVVFGRHHYRLPNRALDDSADGTIIRLVVPVSR